MTNHTEYAADPDRQLRHSGSKVHVTVIGCVTRSGLGDLDGVWAFCRMDDTGERIWIHSTDLEAVPA